MSRCRAIRILLALALLVPVAAVWASAQDDPDELPLGDVARNLRKKAPPAKPVIDDDNLPLVMEQADSHHDFGAGLRFLMSGNIPGFQAAAPDVTCSLSFNSNLKSLLTGQYDQMDLPPGELAKIQGKAIVEGDALSVPVFNGTQWHLSELAVAFTVLRKSGISGDLKDAGSPGTDAPPRRDLQADAFQQVRPEKTPDLTMIYRMRAAALPWSSAVFSAPLNMELAPGEEWHWAIVQAKGYPPETYVSGAKPSVAQPVSQEPVPSAVSLKSVEPENAGPIPPQPHE